VFNGKYNLFGMAEPDSLEQNTQPKGKEQLWERVRSITDGEEKREPILLKKL